MPAAAVISVLARSFLAGEPIPDEVYGRGLRTLGRPWRWLRPLAHRYVETFAGHTRPSHREVVRFLLADEDFRRARSHFRSQISIAEWLPEPQRMQPVAAAAGWKLPQIESTGDLADWLCLSPTELEWFADLKGLAYKAGQAKLQHYHYRVLPKSSGGIRLAEIPKQYVKALQRRILSGILDRVPPHPAVHGFVKGRSIRTFAEPHVARHVLLRLDFEDFFPGFPDARVEALFRTLGYPESVADRLAGICTNAVPRWFWTTRPDGVDRTQWQDARQLYDRRHLPQGAPSSPSLANLMTWRLDCRLRGLARSAGASYTRYADDLAFSGDRDFERGIDRFSAHVAAIALEEGFSVNHCKTGIMRQGVRQHLAGVVVNRRASLRRSDLELLKAILTNCVRLGPESQNREAHPRFKAHLQGRIGFVEMIDRAKARPLRALFESIRWEK